MRPWIFGTGTRALEVLNAIALTIGWSLTMLLDDRLLQTPTYLAFNRIGLILAEQRASRSPSPCGPWPGICTERREAQDAAGISLLGSALAWALVTASFIASYPPTNTAVTLYAALSMLPASLGSTPIFESEVRKRNWKAPCTAE